MKHFAFVLAKALILFTFGFSAKPAWPTGGRPPERAIDKQVSVAAPVSQVWRAWTTAEGMREFLGVNATIELKFGGRYEVLFNKDGLIGQQGSEGCQVVSYVPNKMLSFTWNAPPSIPAMRNQRTFVSLLFTADGNRTTVELHHAGWGEGSNWDKAYRYFDEAWTGVLQALKARFETGPAKDADPPISKPAKPDTTPLEKLATMIGGTWRGEVKGPDGPLVVEFQYKRHKDGKGVIGDGVIGKGSKNPLWVHSQFGWDPIAKAVYYFDTHDSQTLYFGHLALENEDLVFTFSPIGMLSQVFQARGHLKDENTYENVILDETGARIVGLTLRRQK